MFGDQPQQLPQQIAFLLLPGFSMIGLAAMVDPLRWANTLQRQECYRWQMLSLGGRPVRSSNDISLMADDAIESVAGINTLVVCAGFHPQEQLNGTLAGALRRLAALGVDIGGQDTGSYILAAAGLLEGYSATIHWENHDSYREAFRNVTVVEELFDIDRNRFSCSGGLSGLDMMLHLVREQHGAELAAAISDQLIYPSAREGSEPQRLSLQSRYGVANAKVLESIENMQAHFEHTLPIPELARRVHISERELERLFRHHLDTTPLAFYRRLRLEKAQQLLQQTSFSITNIALRCGFASTAHFSRSYRRHFGHSPRQARNRED
ncbi:helix-turn-helix domain-containing protein [Seongchinamella sediminis]|uniref:Helix-turn-helix domain-containing protein n=2 Tax=Seongchinamella sediminis TaxID=2283635 RepID=A0A3L7DSY5_9GAMM|nr:helix-turn-helix domain-containing protein [Seongchinamella sediminis]